MNRKINPDSRVLQDVDGYWQKIAAFLLWKLAGTSKVVITAKDMQDMSENFAPGIPCVFTHGKAESLEFSLVTEAEAVRLAEFDRQTRSQKK